jgi:hypothetical protein
MIIKPRILLSLTAVLLALSVHRAGAWDYEGHRIVNQLALASLPRDFPDFVRPAAAAERIAFLSGEPDRWRSVRDLPLRHVNGPDHYIDLEQLSDYGLSPEKLPLLRYDFVAQLARVRTAHPERFAPIAAEMDADHTRELVGLLPWAITENCEKLKAVFGYLKAYQDAGGTPEEVANAQANAVYIMGVMGHFVGDGSQPLHTSIHHHGWVGANPRGYTTNYSFHQWIDGEYFRKTGGLKLETMAAKIQPATAVGDPARPDTLFRAVVAFLSDENKMVEPLYQLERDGKLSAQGDKGLEGKAFLEAQLVKAGQMLGDLWLTAWKQAPVDAYLERQLALRKSAGGDSK